MAVQAYINFRGNCKEAVTFYSEVFETEQPKFMLFGEMPPDPEYPMDEETKAQIMHTNLMIEGSLVMFSDTPAFMPFTQGDNITLVVQFGDEEKLRRQFEKLSLGGNVAMPLQKTFWSPCYGMLTDRFGIGWQFSLEA